MTALFLKLLNMSIVASWVILAVLVLRLFFKKAPKWTLGILWAMVAVRLIVPFSIQSPLSLVPRTLSNAGESIRIEGESEFLAEGTVSASSPSASDGVDIETGIPTTEPIVQNEFLTFEDLTAFLSKVLSYVWLIGVVVCLLYVLVSYLRLVYKVKPSFLQKENIYLCDSIQTPFLLGMLKPRIYVPSSLSATEREYVIAHERAHLHRRDNIWKPLGFLILSFHWFNPLVWVAYVYFSKDIEFACDERVIKSYTPEETVSYTNALLQCSMPRKLISACPVAFGETKVKQRIQSVLHYKKTSRYILAGVLFLCAICLICFLTDPINTVVYQRIELVRGETTPDGPSDLDKTVGLFTKVTSSVTETFPKNMPVYEITPCEIDDETWAQFLTHFGMSLPDRISKSNRVEENDSIAYRSKNKLTYYIADHSENPMSYSDEAVIEKAKAMFASFPFVDGTYECGGIDSRRIRSTGDQTFTISKSVVFYRQIEGERILGDACYMDFTAEGLCQLSIVRYEYKQVDVIPMISLQKAIDKVKHPDTFYVDDNDTKLSGKADVLHVEKARLVYVNQYSFGCTILQPVYNLTGYAEDDSGTVPFTAKVIAIPDKYTYRDDSNQQYY